MTDSNDDFLPIRRILVDGQHERFIRDIDFDSELVDVTVDQATQVATVRLKTGDVLDSPTAADDTGRLNTIFAAAATAGTQVRLQRGATYRVGSDLLIPSNLDLDGQGATITTHSSWTNGGDADDRTDCMLRARGVVTGTVNTTLNGTKPAHSPSLIVSSATGIAAGMYMLLSGSYSGAPPTGDSYSGAVVEIVQVDSSYTSGTTIPLVSPTRLHHATGCAVQSITPITNVTIRNLRLSSGSKTIPAGIELTNAIGVTLEHIETTGFTRADVDMYAAHEVTIDSHVMRGNSNGGLRASASHNVHASRIRWTGENGRQHASGITRHVVMIDTMSTHVQVHGLTIRRAAGGARIWGGHMCGVDGFDMMDIDGTQIISDAPSTERVTGDPGSSIGIAFDGGCGPINTNTAFGHGCFFKNGTIRNVRQSATASTYFHFAISWHDHYEAELSGIQLIQTGNHDSSVGGVFLCDSSGPVRTLNVKGYGHALETRNTVHDLLLAGIRLDASANNANGQYAIVFGGTAPISASLRIVDIEVSNFNSAVYHFTSDWTSNPNRTYTSIDTLVMDGRMYRTVRPFSLANLTAPGTVCTLSGGSPEMVAATAPAREQWICCDYPSSNWALCARDAGWVLYSGSAAIAGDHLIAHTDGTAKKDNTAAPSPSTKWCAIMPSSGGFCQVERVGNVA